LFSVYAFSVYPANPSREEVSSMLKLVFRSTLIAFLCSTILDARAETMTWQFQNNTFDLLMLKLYSQSRPHVWPGDQQVYYIPADGKTQSYPISCIAGENICYVPGWEADRTTWGVGPGGRLRCTDCCYHCGDQTQTYNLSSCRPGGPCE
jgi:hypothetical protein